MKFKTAIAAVAVAAASLGAQASVITGNGVTSVVGSFTNQEVTNVIVTGLSNVTGSFDYLVSATGASGASYVGSAVTGLTTSLYLGNALKGTSTGLNYSFSNLLSGTYTLKASGTVANGGFNVLITSYTVTPVPEPETYAMLLAGLGVMGAIARRRSKTAA
nr:FxDxF family PEP-CTERM protein [Rhodoferax bucti]